MKCTKQCTKTRPAPLRDHICLQSEALFLQSVLRVIGRFDPRMADALIEAYFDTRRLWRTKGDPKSFAVKLLDQHAKTMFGALQVTAQSVGPDSSTSDSKNPLVLLSVSAPVEARLVDAVLNAVRARHGGALSDGIYEVPSGPYAALCRKTSVAAKSWIDAIGSTGVSPDAGSQFTDTIACRKGFLAIERLLRFEWTFEDSTYDILVLFDKDFAKDSAFRGFGFESIEACFAVCAAFLNGLAKFILTDETRHRENQSKDGHILGEHLFRPSGAILSPAIERPPSVATVKMEAAGTGVPIASSLAKQPGNEILEILVNLVPKYREQYHKMLLRVDAGIQNRSPEDLLFNLIFLSKLADGGWVWLLDDKQELVLKKRAFMQGIPESVFDDAWKTFRFRDSGVVSHLERKGLLADVVNKPGDELICNQVGYLIDASKPGLRPDLAKLFGRIEACLPGVGLGAFYYFRLTSHRGPRSPQGNSKLPTGALVAVFFLPDDRTAKGAEVSAWEYQALFRRLAEEWRTKLATLAELQDKMEEVLSRAIRQKELEERATAIAGFSHQVGHVFGGKSNLPLYAFHLESICREGRSEKEKKTISARSAQIRYAALLPRAFEDVLCIPEEVLNRWEHHGNAQAFMSLRVLFHEVWDEMAMPILDYVKDAVPDRPMSFKCRGKLLQIVGLKQTAKWRVPNLEAIRAALFECLWNAFEYGEFEGPTATIYVEVVGPPPKVTITIRNPAVKRADREREGGNGIKYAKAMLTSLAAAGRGAQPRTARSILQYCDVDGDYNEAKKMWVAKLTLGGVRTSA